MIILSKEQLELLNENINEYIKPILENVKKKPFSNTIKIVTGEDSSSLIEHVYGSEGEKYIKISLKFILEKFSNNESLKFETIDWLVKSIVALDILEINILKDNFTSNFDKVKNNLTEWNVDFNELALEAAAYILEETVHLNRAKFLGLNFLFKASDLNNKF
jgi:hypothetical protein